MWIDNQESRSYGTSGPYTAWLEAKGFNQPYELDLDLTYGLVVKLNIVQVKIGFTTIKGKKFKEMHVNKAFQHEGVDAGIYLDKPHGFEDQKEIEPRMWKMFHRFKWKLDVMMPGSALKGSVKVITNSTDALEGLDR